MNTSAGLHFPLTPRRRRIKGRHVTARSPHRNYSLLVGRVRSRLNDPADLHSPAGVGVPSTSSRRLAATLLKLRRPDVHGGRSGSQCRSHDRSGSQAERYIEGATKWNPKLSVVSALQAQLFQARMRIHELEIERLSYENKLGNLLRKFGEEKSLWQRREHEKIRGAIGELKDKLFRERKNYQRIEKLNSGLVDELDNAKICAKKLMQDYEEEKKRRELMEKISKELAKEIGKDKAEMKAWIGEALKFQAEMEEERKMLQMAEAWREERVQMKLVDAKQALEDKYCQMNKLVTDLEKFLQTRSVSIGAMELRKAAMIRQAVKAVNINDINEFDVSSITEELTSERGIDKNHMVKHSSVINGHVTTRFDPHLQPEENVTDIHLNVGNLVESEPRNGSNGVCSELTEESREVASTGDIIHKKMSGECGRAKLSKKRELGLPLPDSGNINPYITRGMKGCTEWRNGIQKHSLKARLLEAKIEKEKFLLHQVLKPKT